MDNFKSLVVEPKKTLHSEIMEEMAILALHDRRICHLYRGLLAFPETDLLQLLWSSTKFLSATIDKMEKNSIEKLANRQPMPIVGTCLKCGDKFTMVPKETL